MTTNLSNVTHKEETHRNALLSIPSIHPKKLFQEKNLPTFDQITQKLYDEIASSYLSKQTKPERKVF